MKLTAVICALAAGVALVPGAAWGDDPNDPVLSRSAAARARDHAMIKKLNQNELAYVRERDARYSEGWKAWRDARDRRGRYSEGSDRSQADYRAAREDYARARERYERRMAEWRRAVAACRAGDYRYCGE